MRDVINHTREKYSGEQAATGRHASGSTLASCHKDLSCHKDQTKKAMHWWCEEKHRDRINASEWGRRCTPEGAAGRSARAPAGGDGGGLAGDVGRGPARHWERWVHREWKVTWHLVCIVFWRDNRFGVLRCLAFEPAVQ